MNFRPVIPNEAMRACVSVRMAFAARRLSTEISTTTVEKMILRDSNILDSANAETQVLDVRAFVEAADGRVGFDVIDIALTQEMTTGDDDEEERKNGEGNQEEDAKAYLLCSGSHKDAVE